MNYHYRSINSVERKRDYDSLRTDDIAGAKSKNLKFKDNGKKKLNFHPTNKELNDYFNKESIGGGLGKNSIAYTGLRILDHPIFKTFENRS